MKFADKVIINIAAKSSSAFLLLISSMIMVRSLSKDEYGTFMQVMLVVNSSIMFSFLGFPQSIYYFFQKTISPKKFIVRNVIFSCGIGIVISLLLYLSMPKIAILLNNPVLNLYTLHITLILLMRAPSSIRIPILISSQRLLLNSVLIVVSNITLFLPIMITALLSKSLKLMLFVFVISSCFEFFLYIASMCSVLFQLRGNPDEKGKDRLINVTLKDQVIYAFPIGISSYLGVVGKFIDQYIVSIFYLPVDYALYSRGAIKIPVLSTIQNTIANLVMPKYMEAHQKDDIKSIIDIYHSCAEKVAKINFPVFSFLFATAPSLFVIMFTQEYAAASSILRVYLLGLVFGFTAYGTIPRVTGRTSYVFYSTILFVLLNICLSLILVFILGPIGAAFATLTAGIISAFFLLYKSCKILSVSFARILPWFFLFKLMGISLIASLPIYCLSFYFQPLGIHLIGLLFLEAVIYLYLLIVMLMRSGLIYSDDIDLLKRWLRFDIGKVLRKLAFL